MDSSESKTSEKMKDFKIQQAEELELQKKEADLKKHRVNSQYEKLEEHRSSLFKIKSVDFSATSEAEIAAIQQDFYREEDLLKVKRTFIRPEFKDVPHGPFQLILVGARSGEGKSTTAANLALGTIKDNKKVLLITNEETPYDSYNRVTALQYGFAYGKDIARSEEQKRMLSDNMRNLSPLMRVVHENYEGLSGVTTTIEGMSAILEQIHVSYKKTGDFFDTVIIDYYQNIKISTENPALNEYQVQKMFFQKINQFKKIYPASFIVLAQVRAEKEDKNGNTIEFKERIEGAKEIYNAATCAIEMKSNKMDRTTEWLIRKHRWQSELGQARILTGWDKGLYVRHDLDFIEKVEKEKAAKLGIKIPEGESDGK